MSKKILFLILSIELLVLPFSIYAASGDKLCAMISTIEWITWWIGGSIVVIGWVIAGVLYLTAAGGPRMESAKKALIAAVIGTVLVVLSSTAADIVEDTIGTGEIQSCSTDTPPGSEE